MTTTDLKALAEAVLRRQETAKIPDCPARDTLGVGQRDKMQKRLGNSGDFAVPPAVPDGTPPGQHFVPPCPGVGQKLSQAGQHQPEGVFDQEGDPEAKRLGGVPPEQQNGASPAAATEPPPYEVLGQAGAGERCTLCGGGRGVERMRHRGQVRLWHPACADRYLAATGDQLVTVPVADVVPMSRRADALASLSAATPAEPEPAQVSQGVTGVTPIEKENKRETDAPAAARRADEVAGLSDAEPQRIAARVAQVLARENEATAARWGRQSQPDDGPSAETVAAPSPPDPAAIAARAAELLAQAERNPVITITDHAKAADYYRSRAIRELAPGKPCATVHRLRPSSWSDPHDAPQAGDRCGCCGGTTWWIEGGMVRRGWRCGRCCGPATPFGLRWVET